MALAIGIGVLLLVLATRSSRPSSVAIPGVPPVLATPPDEIRITEATSSARSLPVAQSTASSTGPMAGMSYEQIVKARDLARVAANAVRATPDRHLVIPAVREFQSWVSPRSGPVDGLWGPRTRSAVRTFGGSAAVRGI